MAFQFTYGVNTVVSQPCVQPERMHGLALLTPEYLQWG
jgi:hypothetical protein